MPSPFSDSNRIDVQRFVEAGRTDLALAIQRAEAQGMPRGTVSTGRLAQRVAASLAEAATTKRHLLDAWAVRTAVSEATGSSLLSELAWSLACEAPRRSEGEAIGSAQAPEAVEKLQGRLLERVTASLRKKLPSLPYPDQVAADAFSDAYQSYWSETSTATFDGRSRLSTLVGQIAYRLGRAALTQPAEVSGRDPDEHPDRAPRESDLERKETREALDACMKELPPRRHLVARMRWMDRVDPSKIATFLSMSRSAVSNHLSKARINLQDCLAKRGIPDVLG